MKLKRILGILLIIATLFSLSVFNVNANELSVDEIENYSYVVAVKEDDGVMHYYDKSFAGSDISWESFVDYLKAFDDTTPFHIYKGYVMYKNQFLYLDDRVLPTDYVRPAAVKTYTLAETVVVVENNTIRFNGYADGEKTFSSALSELYGFSHVGGSFGAWYVTYNDYVIYYDDDTDRPVESTTVIVEGKYYPLSTTKICDGVNHVWEVRPSSWKSATCIETGYFRYDCRYCDSVKEVTYPIDTEYGHAWDCVSSIQPTCIQNGIAYYKCTLCSEEYSSILTSYGHNYSKATCTEAAACVNCGDIKQEALGHSVISSVCEGSYCERCLEYFVEPEGHSINYKNECTREGCDYVHGEVVDRPVLDWFVGAGNSVGGFFENVGQGIGSWWNDKAVPGISNVANNISDEIEDLLGNNDDTPGADDVWRILMYVLCAIPIIALIYVVIVVVIKVKGKINSMPKERKRKRRKRKKVE